MPERIVVYAKLPDHTGRCPFCDKAKQWLTEKDIPFTYLELLPSERQQLYDRLELTGNDRTVPQIMLVDDTDGESNRIGGYAELIVSRVETLFQDNGHAPSTPVS